MKGSTLANTLNVSGSGVGGNGALINSNNTTAANYLGSITLGGNTVLGGVGLTNISGAVNSGMYGLTFLNGSFNLSNSTNTLNTVAASGVGTLSLQSGSSFVVGSLGSVVGLTTSGDVNFVTASSNNILINSRINAGGVLNIDPTDISINAPISGTTVTLTGTGSVSYTHLTLPTKRIV